MTDKEIIIKTLEYIKYQSGHSPIMDYWTNLGLSNEDQVRIKILLEDNNFATPHIYDPWSLMITTNGLKVKATDLKDNGRPKRKIIDYEFKKGIKITLLGVVVGFILSAGLEVVSSPFLVQLRSRLFNI